MKEVALIVYKALINNPKDYFNYLIQMTETIIIPFPSKNSTMKKCITAVLKQGLSTSVKQLNYAKSYTLQEGKVKKHQEKLVLFTCEKAKTKQLLRFVKKMNPVDDSQITVVSNTLVE